MQPSRTYKNRDVESCEIWPQRRENEMLQNRAVALLCKLCIPENIERMVNSNVSPMMAVVAVNFPELQEKASYVLTQLEV